METYFRPTGVWNGASRLYTVIKLKKDIPLKDLKGRKGDYVVAIEHSGDNFFTWLLVSFNNDLRITPVGTFGDYSVEGKILGKITKASLYSLLNALHNPGTTPHLTLNSFD